VRKTKYWYGPISLPLLPSSLLFPFSSLPTTLPLLARWSGGVLTPAAESRMEPRPLCDILSQENAFGGKSQLSERSGGMVSSQQNKCPYAIPAHTVPRRALVTAVSVSVAVNKNVLFSLKIVFTTIIINDRNVSSHAVKNCMVTTISI